MGAHTTGHCTMNDTARRLRAQKEYSTDPAYLERMAREDEIRGVDPTIEGGSTPGLLFVATRLRAEVHEAVQVVLSAPAVRPASPIRVLRHLHTAHLTLPTTAIDLTMATT